MYDSIVIGAGHNGLTCAAYLARAGNKVLVVEADPVVGGLCKTQEMLPEAPGYKMSTCALDCLLTNLPRSVVDELNLAKYGLEFVWPDPWGSYINPEGASIGLWRDPARTVEEIKQFSRRDAERFAKLSASLWEVFWCALPYFQDHPTRPSPRTIGEILIRAAKGRRRLRGAARMMMCSPDQLIEEQFEREEVKAMLASLACWSQLPLQEPGSGGTLALIMCYSSYDFGCSRAVGGAGEFTRALADCVIDHGGEVRTAAPVAEVLVRGGAAYGIRLESGEELHTRQVIGALHPTTLMRDMLDQQYVPAETQDEIRALRSSAWNLAPMTINTPLSAFPHLACGRDELWNGLLLMAPTIDHARRAQLACMNGKLPEGADIMVSPVLPSKIDRTLVPDGSEGELLYVYLPTVPFKIGDGDWGDIRESFGESVIDLIDSYAPGLKDNVIGSYVKTPKEIGSQVEGGSLYHVDLSINQLGPNRPTPSLSGYKTPIEGLWHTAAGAHPMGALNGWSGRSTARVVNRQLQGRSDRARQYVATTVRSNGRTAHRPSSNGHAAGGAHVLPQTAREQPNQV